MVKNSYSIVLFRGNLETLHFWDIKSIQGRYQFHEHVSQWGFTKTHHHYSVEASMRDGSKVELVEDWFRPKRIGEIVSLVKRISEKSGAQIAHLDAPFQ